MPDAEMSLMREVDPVISQFFFFIYIWFISLNLGFVSEIIIIRQGPSTTAIFMCTLHQKRIYGTQCQWPPVFSLRLARRRSVVAADIVCVAMNGNYLRADSQCVYKKNILNTLGIIIFPLLCTNKRKIPTLTYQF